MRGKTGIRILGISLVVLLLLPHFSVIAQASNGKLPNFDNETIVIDGCYDDWENLPKTMITWGYQESQNVVSHEAAMLRKGNDLYVYMRNSIDYSKPVLEKENLRISANKRNGNLKVLPVDENGKRLDESNPDYPNGIYKNYAVFVENFNHKLSSDYLVPVGDEVAYTVTKDEDGRRIEGDAIEFKIDLEKLAEAFKKKPKNIKDISIMNLFLGDQWVRAVGSPTYAVVFFLIALPIVIAGYVGYEKKKRGVA